MRLISAMLIAFTTYSRLPMRQVEWSEENRRYALCFLPLVGVVVGGVTALWLTLAQRLSPFARGAVAAALPLWLTGSIHMDGFLDTSDALASWQPPEKRLEILKDSCVGAGAVMACGVYLLLFAAVLGEANAADAPALALCFVVSRTMSAWTSVALKNARPGGMLDGFSRAAQKKAVERTCAVILALCTVCWLLLLGWKALLPLLAAGLCAAYYRRMTYRNFGGVTGDLTGWLTQVSELCMLAAITMGGKL